MTDGAWIAAGGLLTAAWLPFAGLSLRSLAQTKLLSEVLEESEARGGGGPPPTLSVVVTARDEERDIEATVRRFAAQRLDGLEIVVVDDRSEDRTGAILDGLVAEFGADRLTVVHNRELPPGRLGKCHACALGAARTRGAWILFADGDVVLAEDDLLARLLVHAERLRLDHVTIVPDMRPQGVVEEALTGAFGVAYLLNVRAYQMDKDVPRGGGAIGAFNLMRRSAYDRVGGHALLMMDVADDWKLGRLLKESGARQRLYFGKDLVRCRWQHGLRNVIRGLEKNAFGGFDYRISGVIGATLGMAAVAFGPFALLGAALATGTFAADPRLAAATFAPAFVAAFFVLVNWILYRDRTDSRLASALLFPVGVLLLLVAIWNSTLRILRRGGVAWRGTFYPLEALRRGLVPAGAGARFRPPPAGDA